MIYYLEDLLWWRNTDDQDLQRHCRPGSRDKHQDHVVRQLGPAHVPNPPAVLGTDLVLPE